MSNGPKWLLVGFVVYFACGMGGFDVGGGWSLGLVLRKISAIGLLLNKYNDIYFFLDFLIVTMIPV